MATVGETILSQLGGNRFIAMTGANNFVQGELYLNFKLKSNPKKVGGVMIELDPSDTYTVTFYKIRKFEVIVQKKVHGVFCDMLQDIFTEYTGLYTRI